MRIEGQQQEGQGGWARQGAAGPFEAVVLCGGSGSRLHSVVADRPKALAPVDDEPFLLRLLDQLVTAGCQRIVLCTGHLGDQIERECGVDHAGCELLYSRELSPLGTGGALRAALPLLTAPDVVVLNGDSFVDVDLGRFVTWARSANHGAALVTVQVADARRFGTVECDAHGRLTAFLEKAQETPHFAGAQRINAGVYWLPREVIAAIPNGPCSLERDVLPGLVERGLFAFAASGGLLDIGTPGSYASASAFFRSLADGRRRATKNLLVVDRDGTLIEERHYLADPGAVQLLPGVIDGLRAFAAGGYELAIVTNQSGIGRGYFDEATATAVNAEVVRQLAVQGISVRGVYLCPHRPDEGCTCRKPEPGLMQRAMEDLGYAPQNCLVVGDKKCDVDLGMRLGARTALVRTGYGAATERDGMCAPDLVVDGLVELARCEVRG